MGSILRGFNRTVTKTSAQLTEQTLFNSHTRNMFILLVDSLVIEHRVSRRLLIAYMLISHILTQFTKL